MSHPNLHSPEITRQIEVLEDEIAFQNVLFASIDDNVQDREQAEQDIRDEICSLERQLKDLKRCTSAATITTASNYPSSQNSSQSFQAAFSSSSRKNNAISNLDGGVDGEPAGEMNGYLGQGQDQWRPLASHSLTPSTPGSDPLGNPLLTPSHTKLSARKRSHSKYLDDQLAPVEGNKSRRTSQSPFGTGPPTPSTISSGEDSFSAWQRKQNDEATRIKREREDAELARIIQESLDNLSTSSMQPPARSDRSAFDRLSGAHQLSSSSGSPYSSSLSQQGSTYSGPSRSMTPGTKREVPRSSMSGLSSYASSNPPSGFTRKTPADPSYTSSAFKSERPSRPIPGSYQDDSSNASDSDIEIIPASAFRANGRSSRPTGNMANSYTLPSPLPKSKPLGFGNSAADVQFLRQQAASTSNDTLQRAMFGTHPKPQWMNAVQPSMGGGNMLSKNEISSAYSMNDIPVYQSHGSMAMAGSPPHSNFFEDIITRGGDSINAVSAYLGLNDHMLDQLGYIMNDPRKNAEEIKNLLENIRPDEEVAPEDREGTPEGLVYPLYEHQKIALGWLKNMEVGNNKGGILADDMGLGKTISALALILSRPSSDPARKTTLIVGPVALVRQWGREFRSKILPGYRLSVFMAHGTTKSLNWDEIRTYDVVLTTYGKLGHEYKRLQKFRDNHKLNGGMADHNAMKKDFPFLGPKSKFYRVILDEAQCIKNKSTHAARGCCSIAARYRFCLTGTPMMNNVQELYSLINFLRIGPYDEWTRFNSTFGILTKADKKSKQSVLERDLKNAMTKLQALLKAILLRRTKKTEIDGKPIITLPPKTEEIQHVVFDEDEQAFYTALECKTQTQFNKFVKAGTVTKNYANVLVLLLRLRQASCHPHLIQDFEQAPVSASDVTLETMRELARGLKPDVIARLLDSNDIFECPVCYDPASNPKIITPCGHDTCSECLAKITDQAVQQNVAAGNDAGGNAKCPTCRGDLFKEKVIDYSAFKEVHKPAIESTDDFETASDDSDDDSEYDNESDSDTASEKDADARGNLKGFVVSDDQDEEVDDDETASEDDDGPEVMVEKSQSKSNDTGKGKEKEQKHKQLKKSKGKDKGKQPGKKQHISIAMLKKEASKSAAGRRRYMKYLRKHWVPSAKTTKCVELLDQFQADGQKTIIFSQFVSLLDLLQVPIDEKGWKCLRYDGSMSADARNNAVNQFCDSRDYNIMLISLKAGNAGLNLVAASRVIILDPFWNPYIEMQAVDRAYRIGQQHSVEVHRILVEGTVEDRIIDLQNRKKELVESALDENAAKSVSRLGVAELAFLFNG
ncbi:uncharacterized protein L3040_008273 [Drepanopeziza brunnea f. sp. 'multigermtubi']|uniref:SWI/SNF family DNA-dependent ATPase Ris1 n=1 Tax=Marssonina brunnea f. sp. multigermtubi (strain MB_m1) TaxID=1072389 RepID=K1WN82_MARBU|nr:SWI/SNF family DNA-dependent ATPase Ris1 [Drepanopeziza brunnea f. sp. 'multigermtubi' MB_m1]EKD14371.1 SWI/SNF family DNA-dependent ATPase Ris1 [Drepanopeziza brunnea f. sp. 'multigermtubi' MB_m1]KAJ5035011.1 hypothetical protein L3040_008273 [Drepanopeziza brunnea f. sp. 'multigermtubi']